jgi:sugar phosphate isomerase/epimerase
MNNLKQRWKEFGTWVCNYYGCANLKIEKAKITYIYYFPTRIRHDADNYNCKFLGDSLVQSGTLIDDDFERRTAAVSRLKSFIDLAGEMNAAVLVGRMKSHIGDFSKQDYYESLLADSMLRAGEYAERKGVEIMLEAINRYESNYSYTIDSVASLITRYDIPSTRILMDTFHMNIEEAELCQAVERNFSLLGYFHFADSNRLYPGGGHTDLKAVYQTLCNLGYEGYIGIECLPIPDGDTAAKKAMSYMKSLPFRFAKK